MWDFTAWATIIGACVPVIPACVSATMYYFQYIQRGRSRSRVVSTIPAVVHQRLTYAHEHYGEFVQEYVRDQLVGAMREGWTPALSTTATDSIEQISEAAFLHYLAFLLADRRNHGDSFKQLVRCAQHATTDYFAEQYSATPADEWVNRLRRRRLL